MNSREKKINLQTMLSYWSYHHPRSSILSHDRLNRDRIQMSIAKGAYNTVTVTVGKQSN